jgi:hypothetical protein
MSKPTKLRGKWVEGCQSIQTMISEFQALEMLSIVIRQVPEEITKKLIASLTLSDKSNINRMILPPKRKVAILDEIKKLQFNKYPFFS